MDNKKGEKMNKEIETNERFDKLTNRDISIYYIDKSFWLSLSTIQAAMCFWVVAQNPNKKLIEINPALRAFTEYISTFFDNTTLPEKFTYKRLSDAITEDTLGNIPEILEFNKLKPDFIDLGALARNIFYMILRETITQGEKRWDI